ncbi:Nitrogen assimilation transcription factor nirA [Colletotrichum sidae]|uniref:Nitrogen assimilation transcription factor nirA n=1 Tax=Colletotrichum sidae TaxID=1347389 RepID=A0A4R8TN84_9PEZI|nr:Nitrogen assimilation transcription factor nirA [Colletotrichum sidae]
MYRSEEDGRKPASKSYVQLLRNRIDLLEAVLQSHSIDIEASVTQLSANGSTPQLNPVGSSLVSGSDPVLAGLSSTAFDDLCATFEGALSLNESVNYDQDGEMRYFGPSSGRLEFQADSSPETDDQGSSPATIKSVELNRYILPIESEEYPDDLKNELIDMFFKYHNPGFQVIDEKLFRHSMKSKGRFYSPLLLNCMMAVGSRYSDRIDVRSVPEDSNTAGKPFLHKAEVLLHYDMKRPTLTTIQSMAILVGAYVSYGCDAAGWLHQGMANRLALDMGLNLDASSLAGSNLMSSEEIELRRQIYWALYCDDKLAAIYTGRDVQGAVNLPSVIPPEKLNDPLNDMSGLQRCNKMILVHRALIGVCRILENILLALYAPKPLYKGPQRISFLHSCTLELKTWFYELPADLRIDRPNDLPQVYTLNMIYHTCCILLFKPFLHRPKSSTPSSKPELVRRAEVLCVESAKRICLAGKKYRQVFGGFRRSPISATHCTLTAALVLIQYASPDPDMSSSGRPCCTPYIEMCLEVLGELSTSWNPAGRMRADLIRLLYQKYPKRIPHALLHCEKSFAARPPTHCERGLPLTTAQTHPLQTHPTLEQNLCPLLNMIGQDFSWSGPDGEMQGLESVSFAEGSESAFNSQFALSDSIMDMGDQGMGLTDDAFWAGVNFDFGFEAQS